MQIAWLIGEAGRREEDAAGYFRFPVSRRRENVYKIGWKWKEERAGMKWQKVRKRKGEGDIKRRKRRRGRVKWQLKGSTNHPELEEEEGRIY